MRSHNWGATTPTKFQAFEETGLDLLQADFETFVFGSYSRLRKRQLLIAAVMICTYSWALTLGDFGLLAHPDSTSVYVRRRREPSPYPPFCCSSFLRFFMAFTVSMTSAQARSMCESIERCASNLKPSYSLRCSGRAGHRRNAGNAW
jgi:hypothetical protein